MLTEIRDVWRNTPAGLKRYSKISYSIGSVLFVLGVCADVFSGDWDTWGFSTNILTSIVGFLFGIPVALIGLDAVNERRVHTTEVTRAKKRINSTWTTFAEEVEKPCSDALIDKPVALTSEITDCFLKGVNAFKGYIELESKDSEALQNMRDILEESADVMEARLDELTKALPKAGVLNFHWLRMKIDWDVISVTIRSTCSDLDLDWLTTLHDTRLRHHLKPDSHPLLDVWNAKTKNSDVNKQDSADKTPMIFRELTTLESTQFRHNNSKVKAMLESKSVVDLRLSAVSAASVMKSLRMTVRDVTESAFVKQASITPPG